MMRRIVLTETASGLTYTAQTSVPVGARILDVLVETTAAWSAATIAVDVGDSDASDALASAVDASGVVFSSGVNNGGTAWGNAGGDGAAYSDTASGGTGKLYPAGDIITVVGTATTPAGPTGLTYVTLLLETASVVKQSTVA